MYEHEEVEENEGKDLAKELNAIFQKTSAKEAYGVEDLFEKIGRKVLNPSSTEVEETPTKNEVKEDKKKIKLEKNKVEQKPKKKCC